MQRGVSTPIHHATQNKHIDAIKILLNANANPNIRNKNGNTPSDLAKYSHCTKAIQ